MQSRPIQEEGITYLGSEHNRYRPMLPWKAILDRARRVAILNKVSACQQVSMGASVQSSVKDEKHNGNLHRVL